ncbi:MULTISPECIES: ABC transporter substrate-binding protein [unclassified Nocardioides]|uniref:ABC transporter substrate-binding protein n=1 Tax=unclassified Nocardioides TaxID=2615069 RepID=UPI00070366B2|nr:MULTISPECIES: ABC transporter substrate-binding protein [unclassified Nocardioides]KQZ74950.1 hypothetical protein ASD66_00770 [Nocardioides sp. Root151]KRF10485.1 hypothetical protein ASH02_20510 [Nocardioides sp. Soil796]
MPDQKTLSLRRRPGLVLGVALGLLALLLTSCGSSANTSGDGEIDSSATLRLTYTGVQTLDPATTPGSTAVLSNTWPVYDRLLQISEDGEYLPMLATKWTFSKDGLTLRLDLRDGVTFSDGTPFTADTVKANIARYRGEDVSKSATAIIKDVEVVDEHAVDLHLASPSRAVLGSLAAAAPGIMISEKALDNPDLGTNPVGSGAWVIDSFRPAERVTYKLRSDKDGIWDKETGKVAKVEIAVRTTSTAFAAIRSGQVDVVLSGGDVSELKSGIDQGTLKIRPLKNASTTAALHLNQTVKPFDDVRVRQAVNYAINRKPLVDALVPTTTARVQPMASVVNGFDESLESTYSYDPDRARELLKEAGHENGVDGGTFYVANYEPFPDAAQVVQADLASVGIKVDLELYDIRQLSSGTYGDSDRPGAFMFMSYPSLEPGVALSQFLENPLVFPGGVPAEVGTQIAAIDDSTATQEERAGRAGAVVKWATDQALYAPLWQGVPGWVMTNKVHGVEDGKAFLAPLGGQDFRYAWISK